MSSIDSTVRVPLTNSSLVAIIDAQDTTLVMAYTWRVQSAKGRPMSIRARQQGAKAVLLHRLLLCPPDGLVVDHRDGDIFNNQRSNLRICTNSENLKNTKPRSHSSSGVRNVQLRNKGRGRKSWCATVTSDGKVYRKWFGSTDDAKLRASQWAEEIRHRLHGEFAYAPRQKGPSTG